MEVYNQVQYEGCFFCLPACKFYPSKKYIHAPIQRMDRHSELKKICFSIAAMYIYCSYDTQIHAVCEGYVV